MLRHRRSGTSIQADSLRVASDLLSARSLAPSQLFLPEHELVHPFGWSSERTSSLPGVSPVIAPDFHEPLKGAPASIMIAARRPRDELEPAPASALAGWALTCLVCELLRRSHAKEAAGEGHRHRRRSTITVRHDLRPLGARQRTKPRGQGQAHRSRGVASASAGTGRRGSSSSSSAPQGGAAGGPAG